MDALTDFLIGLLAAYGVFSMIRNVMVFHWRMGILNDDGLQLYQRLPPYHVMLHHPKYWLMWTQSAWRDFAIAHGVDGIPLVPIDHDMLGKPIYAPLRPDMVMPVTDPDEIERVRKQVADLMDFIAKRTGGN